MPFAQRPDTFPDPKRQPLEHPAGLREISHIELVAPNTQSTSPELKALNNQGLLHLCEGIDYILKIGFDGETQGQAADFRPTLPLIFQW